MRYVVSVLICGLCQAVQLRTFERIRETCVFNRVYSTKRIVENYKKIKKEIYTLLNFGMYPGFSEDAAIIFFVETFCYIF